MAICFTISNNHRCLDLWKFDNTLILVFAPLLFLIEIPQNSNIIQHTVLLACVEWMILFFGIGSLLNLYHQFMYFNAEELLEMRQCSDRSVYTAITRLKTRLKIMAPLVYREFLQAGSFYSYLSGI